MKVYLGLDNLPTFKNPVITIGTFDGVHLGHANIIERLKNKAKEIDGESIIITFEPHPRRVLGNSSHSIDLLTTLSEKIIALEAMQIDHLVVVEFTPAFSEISAMAYIQDFIVRYFHPHTFVIGYDHHFGKDRLGNFHLLESVKDQYGFDLVEIPVREIEASAISSTKIRAALHQGDIQKANHLLGTCYSLQGIVAHGEQRGRLIGFPTANIKPDNHEKLIPANGVYAVYVYLDGKQYKGMLNIGVRPTVSSNHIRSIEVHIFDFHDDIYNHSIRVEFLERLRDELQFENVDALVNQLKKDQTKAIEILQQNNSIAK